MTASDDEDLSDAFVQNLSDDPDEPSVLVVDRQHDITLWTGDVVTVVSGERLHAYRMGPDVLVYSGWEPQTVH